MPDWSFINGSNIKSNGAANIILPAKISITPIRRENITIKNLILFEILCVLAFENQDKTKKDKLSIKGKIIIINKFNNNYIDITIPNEDKAKIKIIKIIIPKKSKFIY